MDTWMGIDSEPIILSCSNCLLLVIPQQGRIWTPPRLQVICLWLLARLHTYIRPLKLAYVDAGP